MRSFMRMRPAAALAALLAAAALFGSCYPGDDLTVSETDIVVTAFNQDIDFATLTTYALNDTVVHLVPDGEDDDITRAYDDEILQEVRDNLNDLGFTEVVDPDAADALVVVAVTVSDYTGYYSYSPCYYYCWYYPPGWGWYYPPYMASYSFSVGTIIINMAERVDPGSSEGDVPVAWVGALNGYSSSSSNLTRIRGGIDQAFAQSQYLGAGK